MTAREHAIAGIPVPSASASNASAQFAAQHAEDSLVCAPPSHSNEQVSINPEGLLGPDPVYAYPVATGLPSCLVKDNTDDHPASPTASEDEPMINGPTYSIERNPDSPNGPHLLHCLASDGDPSRWAPLGPRTDSKGCPCEWQACDQNHELYIRWLTNVGKHVAEALQLKQGLDEEWRLADFPRGYKLFNYIKKAPKFREDQYLLGSHLVTKFRTVNEFSPHCIWLCTPFEFRKPCQCKYCANVKRQQDVNVTLGWDTGDGKPGTKSPRAFKKKRFSSSPGPVGGKKDQGGALLGFANTQLRQRGGTGAPSSSDSAPKRPAGKLRRSAPKHVEREPVVAPSPSVYEGPYAAVDRERDLEKAGCTYRKGEMIWCRLDSPIKGGWKGDVAIAYWPGLCESRQLVSAARVMESNYGGTIAGDERPRHDIVRFQVAQSVRWRVRLLGLSDTIHREEAQMVPWLNYPPPSELFDIPLDEIPHHIRDGQQTERPYLSSFSDLRTAITPFALALQMAAHVVSYWNLYDHFEISAIAKSRHVLEHMDEGAQPAYKRNGAKYWFQGLWWGAEKIWSGELVRLIVGCDDLPDDLQPTPGSDEKCCFLRITGIYRDLLDRAMIKGPIFELAPTEGRSNRSTSRVLCDEPHMPEAPPGFCFRRLSPIGEERHLVLEHIAGRYYPPDRLAIPPSRDSSLGASSAAFRSRSLCGLTRGGDLYMRCLHWIPDRRQALQDSEALAEGEMAFHFQKQG